MRLALCGIVTALGTVLMLMAGIITVGTYTFPALAGMLGIAIVIEAGARWAWMVYAAVSLLSAFLVGDKEAVLLFVLFFGYYPILKSHLERIPRKALVWMFKFLLFNAAVFVTALAAIFVLQVPPESFLAGGGLLAAVFLLAANAVFWVYDFILSGFVVLYYQRFHLALEKWMKRK